MGDLTALEARLAQLERELALLLEMDRLRDEMTADPRQMLVAITETVTQALRADAGLLVLKDETSQITLSATADPDSMVPTLDRDTLHQISRAATELHAAALLEPGDALEKEGVRHLVITPLRVGGQCLGGMVYLSRKRRFDDRDVALLRTAASQADSAIVQARTWRQLQISSRAIQERNRQLDAIYRVDRIRDETTDVNRLLMQVADVLVDVLDVDLCMVGLTEDEGEGIVLRAVNDRLHVLSELGPEAVQEVLDRAISLEAVSWLPAEEALVTQKLRQLLAAPLIVDQTRLGAFVLANREERLCSADVDLVRAVVSQVDSAVMHVRTFQSAQERARQLEAIYRIDRIRDEAAGAQDILSVVVHIVASALDAGLCLMSLIDEESGQSELKAIQDRQGMFGRLEQDAVRQAVEWASGRGGVSVLEGDSPWARWGLKHLMGAPLVVAGEQLGCLVLARVHPPFGRADRELLHAIVSQTDSAIVHARAERRLRQRNKELEILYRVDHIRDQGYEFGEMLSAVLSELCVAIEAEMGFVMLFDQEGRQLELKASTADDILASTGHYQLIDRAAGEALRTGKLYAAEGLSEWLHSVMCVPLILRDRIIGVFGAVNRRGLGAFTADDRRLLLAITSQVDTAIFESLDKQRIRETFRRYVGPSVMEQMLAIPEKDFLKGERALLTVLFSDMRGFTSMSERVPVDVLVEMVDMHLGAMTAIVLAHSGTLDKFVADQVVAIFGAPLYMQDHAIRALNAALDMQARQQELIAEWAERGYCLPPIGIGISTGEMIVGNIGCEQQMDYTVIGETVNVASRLCDAAAGNQILIAEPTYDQVAELIRAEKLAKMRLDGIKEPVQAYQVISFEKRELRPKP